MRICLACLEQYTKKLEQLDDGSIEYGLISYWYIRNNTDRLNLILKKCKILLVDSGAHTLQHSMKKGTDPSLFEKYVDEYMNFIQKWTDNPQIEGFFEMDIDVVVGYPKVLEWRRKLEQVSDKIIPVWHGGLGGIRGYDIEDSQFNLFVNAAHKAGCRIHILGFTRLPYLQCLNLDENDSVDSSSWVMSGVFGTLLAVDKNNLFEQFSFCKGLKVKNATMKGLNFLSFRHAQRIYDKINSHIPLDVLKD